MEKSNEFRKTVTQPLVVGSDADAICSAETIEAKKAAAQESSCHDETITVPSPGARGTARSAGEDVPGHEILSVLGRGGMGVVYKARHIKLGRVVALKTILAGAHAGPLEFVRFRTEAEAVARLQHPNIVQIHEIGEHNGLPFFSLEYCAGGNLAQAIQGTPMKPLRAAQIVETLARAIDVAHKNNVIHRDLKPANVLLTEDGIPKITDFGLAKKLDDAGQTQTGAIMGTPSYMAPEQASGKTKDLTPLADVYALGAILYELLTGRPPFKGPTSLDTLLQVANNEPVPPRQLQPRVPLDLETICLKCLRKRPDERYASAEKLADDLARFQAGAPIEARPIGNVERLCKWVRRRPAVAALIAASLLMVVGGSAAGLYLLKSDRDRLQAQMDKQHADNQRLQAEADRIKADQARRLADEARGQADEAKRKAVLARQEAERARNDSIIEQAWNRLAVDVKEIKKKYASMGHVSKTGRFGFPEFGRGPEIGSGIPQLGVPGIGSGLPQMGVPGIGGGVPGFDSRPGKNGGFSNRLPGQPGFSGNAPPPPKIPGFDSALESPLENLNRRYYEHSHFRPRFHSVPPIKVTLGNVSFNAVWDPSEESYIDEAFQDEFLEYLSRTIDHLLSSDQERSLFWFNHGGSRLFGVINRTEGFLALDRKMQELINRNPPFPPGPPVPLAAP